MKYYSSMLYNALIQIFLDFNLQPTNHSSIPNTPRQCHLQRHLQPCKNQVTRVNSVPHDFHFRPPTYSTTTDENDKSEDNKRQNKEMQQGRSKWQVLDIAHIHKRF